MSRSQSINLESVISQSDEQVASELDGEIVMMSLEQGQYFGLDSIGSRIWALIEAPTQVSNIIDTLLNEYNVSRDACEKDVLALLNKLSEKNIIVTK